MFVGRFLRQLFLFTLMLPEASNFRLEGISLPLQEISFYIYTVIQKQNQQKLILRWSFMRSLEFHLVI